MKLVTRPYLFLILVSAIFLFFWLQKPLLSYFSQDDFFHLRLVMDKKISDIPWFFTNFLEGQTFYRPLSRETYNLLIYTVFGLNPLPFHVVNLLLILANLVLIYLTIRKLNKNHFLAYFTLIIYFFSSIHSIELYYLASVQTLMATTFSLFCLQFYINYFTERNINYYLSSILFFLISLLCHESAIVLPGIIFLTNFVIQGPTLKEKTLLTLPFIFLSIFYFTTTIDLSNLPKQQIYQPVFQIKTILNTLGWYILWSFGLPETIVDFVKPGFILKEEFIIWYRDYVKIVFPLLFIAISFLIMKVWFQRKTLFSEFFLFFAIGSFIISISPFLLFPQHKFVYYLSLPIIWFSTALGFILANSWKAGNIYKLLTILMLISFIIISYQTNTLNITTHWAAKRAKAAEVLIQQIKLDHPSVPKGSVFYIKDDPYYPDIAKEWGTSSKQAFYILSGKDAVQLIYNDLTIRAYFEDVNDLPLNVDPQKIITLTAKFPY